MRAPKAVVEEACLAAIKLTTLFVEREDTADVVRSPETWETGAEGTVISQGIFRRRPMSRERNVQ